MNRKKGSRKEIEAFFLLILFRLKKEMEMNK